MKSAFWNFCCQITLIHSRVAAQLIIDLDDPAEWRGRVQKAFISVTLKAKGYMLAYSNLRNWGVYVHAAER